jgi:hypothetical protein
MVLPLFVTTTFTVEARRRSRHRPRLIQSRGAVDG